MMFSPRNAAVSFVERWLARHSTACTLTANLCCICPAANSFSISRVSSPEIFGITDFPMRKVYHGLFSLSVLFGTLGRNYVAFSHVFDPRLCGQSRKVNRSKTLHFLVTPRWHFFPAFHPVKYFTFSSWRRRIS